MEQELNFILQFILFALTGLTGIAVLIFALRKKDNTPLLHLTGKHLKGQ